MTSSAHLIRRLRLIILWNIRRFRMRRVSLCKIANLIGMPELLSDQHKHSDKKILRDLALRLACVRGVPADALFK